MSEFRSADTAAIVQEVTALLARSEIAPAIAMARKALDSGVEAPLLLNLRAYWFEGESRPRDALTDLMRARELAPDDPMVLNALGLCLAKLGKLDEAYEAFRQCVALAPEFGPGHFNCGWTLEELGELDRAQDAFKEAARLDPASPDPLGRLAALAARRGQWDGARDFAERALAIMPDHAAAAIALASAELSEKSYAAAKARLGRVIDLARISPQDRATAIGVLGDVLDGQARYHEAFAAYSASKALFKSVFADSIAMQTEMPMSDYVDLLSTGFAPLEPWSKTDMSRLAHDHDACRSPHDHGPEKHVFLLGFPRSGTTLIEEVLACHPDVSTTGERDALADIVHRLFAGPDDVARVKNLDVEDISRVRARYWASLRNFGITFEGRILIDKQPFNTVRLPLIARLFPEAKIVFCVRDPRDVVLSCFRRRFAINGSNAEFLSLDSTAKLYDAVMQLAAAYKSRLPMELIEIRNEDLVEDFDARIQAICDFAGIGWVDAFRDFARRSSDRQVVTPSAVQIKRGLGREGIGHWRNYEADLAPVLPLLNGWAERLGYE